MSITARSIKDDDGEAQEVSNIDCIGSKAGESANGIVVGTYDRGKVDVPVVLVLVTDRSYHLCFSVVDPFYT